MSALPSDQKKWCRAYNKLTSSALSWQSQAPEADEPLSVKQALVNKGLQGLNKLHRKVTAPKKDLDKGKLANPVAIPPPVAPLPWESAPDEGDIFASASETETDP